jgi:hypothetical protein
MKTETRSIESFDKINFKDFGTLILKQGDRESLTIEADEELMDDLISEVRGSTLYLGLEEDWFSRLGKLVSTIFTSSEYKVTYILTFVSLEKISVSGKCNLQCDSIHADTLKTSVSGYGNLKFGQIEADELKINISGRGEFRGEGNANKLSINISGSGDFQAPNLSSQTAKVTISGQGNATIRAEESLDITISGVGEVKYYGRPKLRQVISGLGKSNRISDS